jgi:hypothetical protein
MRGVVLLLLALAGTAEAHDVRGEALILEVGEDVSAELHVPAAQLALARGQSTLEVLAIPDDELATEVAAHVTLRSLDGTPFPITVERIDRDPRLGREELVVALRFAGRPPLTISDDLVLRTVVNANVFVFERRDDAATLIGSLHYQQRSLEVQPPPPSSTSWITYWPWLAGAIALLSFATLLTMRRPEIP